MRLGLGTLGDEFLALAGEAASIEAGEDLTSSDAIALIGPNFYHRPRPLETEIAAASRHQLTAIGAFDAVAADRFNRDRFHRQRGNLRSLIGSGREQRRDHDEANR